MKRVRRIVAGPAVDAGSLEVTPLLKIRELSFGAGAGGVGISSVRPIAVEVRDGTGYTRTHAVRDWTPWFRFAGLVITILLLILRRPNE